MNLGKNLILEYHLAIIKTFTQHCNLNNFGLYLIRLMIHLTNKIQQNTLNYCFYLFLENDILFSAIQ